MDDLDESVEEEISRLVDGMEENLGMANEFLSEIDKKRVGGTTTWDTGDAFGKQYEFLKHYERWYNSAKVLVGEYLPDRVEEFEESYSIVRKLLQLDLDYLKDKNEATIGLELNNEINFQINILRSIPDRVEAEHLRIRKNISEDVTVEELQKSKKLLDDGHIRASGVLAGVALERHLQSICHQSDADIKIHPDDGITSLAQELSDNNFLTDDDLRLLQHLSGLRNKCAHADDESPNNREVERLINEAEEFIRYST